MSLKTQAVRGTRAVGVSTFLINIVQIAQLLILSRLLAPADFGLMGLALLSINFIALFSDLGIGASVIQKESPSAVGISSLFWTGLFVGWLFFCALWIASPIVSVWFSEPRLTWILRIAGLTLLIAPMGVIHGAFLEKEMQFGGLARIEVVASLLGISAAVGLAFAGATVWALVSALLANQTVRTIGYIAFGRGYWQPAMTFNAGALKEHLSFGVPLAMQRIVNYVTANVDFFFVGKLLGSQVLGHYTMAYNLANLPSSKLSPILSRVFFPLYARIQNDPERLRWGYLRMQEYATLVNVPLLFGMAASAPIFVPLILGKAWLPSVLLLQILCFVGLTRSIAGTIGPLLLARGRSDLGFKWSLLIVAMQVPGIYAGIVLGGVVGLAIAFALLQSITLFLNYHILVRSLVGPCLREYFASICPALLMGLVMASVVVAVPEIPTEMSMWSVLVLQVASGACVYVLLLWIFRKPFLTDIWAMYSKRLA
jgi:O-antigen/teichoic acid export membrane protein